jgi:hypothetical protein
LICSLLRISRSQILNALIDRGSKNSIGNRHVARRVRRFKRNLGSSSQPGGLRKELGVLVIALINDGDYFK